MAKGKNKGIHIKYRKERDTWEVVEYISGSLKRHATGYGSREGAEEKLAEIIVTRGKSLEFTNDPDIGELISYYIKERVEFLASPATALGCLERIIPFWSELKLGDIKESTSLRYIRHREKEYALWQSAKKKKELKKLSMGTIRRELVQLQAAISYCYNANLINQCPKIWKPEKTPPRERWMTHKEAAKLLKATLVMPDDSKHLYLFTLIGLYTGARSEAIRSLKWDDVDFKTNFIHFVRNQRSSKKKYSRVPMPKRLLRELKRAYESRRDCEFVVNYKGNYVASVKRSFASAYKRAGIEKVTPHTMRHTAASWMVQKGVPTSQVGEYIGMTYQMVETVYGHLTPNHLDKARNSYG